MFLSVQKNKMKKIEARKKKMKNEERRNIRRRKKEEKAIADVEESRRK